MKFNVHLETGMVISLSDVEDFSFGVEDETVTFYHQDSTLTVIPRERVLLIKEIAEEPETVH